MSSIITVSGVNKYYAENGVGRRKTHILKDIDLSIHQNEFFIILGPSGAGKSTLVRIISGLEKVDSGGVKYAEGADKEDIGFVFQQFAILPWLTVSENIGLGLVGRKVPPAERKEIIARELKEFRLEKFADAKPHQLSGGMKQRVGLARAFAIDSKIIFLDEPFSELDIFTSEELRAELLHMWQGRGKTIVMISHNITEAVELADRIAVLSSRPGEIKSVVENKLPRPRQQRTPQFYEMEDKLYGLLKQ